MTAPSPASRLDRIDALRGLAMVWMTLFHFCFDLNHFGYLHQNFYADPFWTGQRSCIVAMFLFCAGLSQAVSLQRQLSWARFWRRWGQIAACAALVSAGSVWMFPQSFIYFGVLHALAVMLVVVRLTAGWGQGLWLAGALAIAIKTGAAYAMPAWPWADFLNEKPWNVLGLITRKPITEDYVPLLPWLAWVWWGMAAGQWLLRNRAGWLGGGLPGMLWPLAALGRWSLSYYMLHQPVLIGLLMAAAALR